MKLRRFLLSVMMLAGTFTATQVLAHKVNLFAYAEDGEVYVEGYFVDGKKAQNSKVEVYSPAGELLLEGITNDEGQYRFPVPQQSDLKIVVDAGMGHQSEFIMMADELGGNVVEDDADTFASERAVSDQAAADTASVPSTGNAPPGHQALEAVVNHAVKEAIKPLVRELAASQQKASLSGIVGGVGYIIGFLGLFAYFKARQHDGQK